MIRTKRLAAASFAIVFSFLTLIAPAFAAGANQGSSDVVEAEAFTYIPDCTAINNVDFWPVPITGTLDIAANLPNAATVWTSGSTNCLVGLRSATSVNVDSYYLFLTYENSTYKLYFTGPSSTGYSTLEFKNPGSMFGNSLNSHSGNWYYNIISLSIPSNAVFNIPVFSSIAEALSALDDYVASQGMHAELVPNGDSFSFNSDYSVNNTTGVDIAVASYNLGGNDIMVIGCYETVVVPGTIGGLSANFNVNQILPRDQHIPIRYCSLISDTTFSSLTPFDSLEAAVGACFDVLRESPNHGGGYTPSDVQFTLQPGNVAYIQMADLSEKVILSSAKSSYSSLFQTAGSYWPGNQLYKSGMDYPTSGTVLPGATPNQIPWQKNEWGKENLLGQTKQAYAEITASSNFLMIYNPYYQGDDSSTLTNTNLINSAIVISSKGIARNGIRVYNLQDSFSTVDGNYYYGIGSTNPNGYGDYFQSENDPNATNPDVTGWTDQNGDPTTAPGVTPYNDPPDNDSLADVITGFLSNIGSLFTQGHDAIKNLVESSSEFTSRLSSLYAWLPAPVYSVLMSAIILVIIVGVLKVFL